LEHFTPWESLAGGILIGLSATAVLALLGRVAGISGMLGGVLAGMPGSGPLQAPPADDFERGWRGAFLAGLVAGGAIAAALEPALFAMTLDRSAPALALAGLLVGFGTRLGSGCTSGHGVCGIARGSTRSISATVTFMTTGALTALAITQCFGGRV